MFCILERELLEAAAFRELLKADVTLAQELYRALCNAIWKSPKGEDYAVTFRRAGEIVSLIRDQNENYLDFYCSGGEGIVSKRIEAEMKKLGWTWRAYPEETNY